MKRNITSKITYTVGTVSGEEKEFPIEKMAACIFRDSSGLWVPGYFWKIQSLTPWRGYPFRSMEGNYYNAIAPMAGNEKLIHEFGDVFGLIEASDIKRPVL